MVRRNELKLKLQNGDLVLGCVVTVAWPGMVEMIGLAGFDFVFIDGEHGRISAADCEHMVRAAETRGLVPIVRVAENRPALIQSYMESGAMGIVVPHVETAEEAEAMVRAAKFYPLGMRGMASARSADYGMTQSRAEYIARSNAETLVLPQIESQRAVQNAEEILATVGVDGTILGVNDLSQSLGLPGQSGHAKVQAAIAEVVETARRIGKPVGSEQLAGETALQSFERGIQMVLTGANSLFRAAVTDFVSAARSG